MQCPKCSSPMEAIELLSSRSQRCTNCRGLWLTMGENRLLKPMAEQVDTGDAAIGAQYNHIDRIRCPVCSERQLVRMVDPQQPHIWFESCSHCFGRFYDAGEFRDYAEHTFLEFLRDMDAPERV
ncbi:MAG TPA: zf-TFIIB domain-containing protein [Lysobacter sp.]